VLAASPRGCHLWPLPSPFTCRVGLDIFSAAKGEMQLATRKGNGADLNVWVTTLNNGGIIGWVHSSRKSPVSTGCWHQQMKADQ
jgi:hypothetical protein